MEWCHVCWTLPLFRQRSCPWNRPALVLTLGSVKVRELEGLDTLTESPRPHQQDTPIIERSPLTSTHLLNCVYSETQKRGIYLYYTYTIFLYIYIYIKDIDIIFFLFSVRPSATTLIGHPFFKQVCEIGHVKILHQALHILMLYGDWTIVMWRKNGKDNV